MILVRGHFDNFKVTRRKSEKFLFSLYNFDRKKLEFKLLFHTKIEYDLWSVIILNQYHLTKLKVTGKKCKICFRSIINVSYGARETLLTDHL